MKAVRFVLLLGALFVGFSAPAQNAFQRNRKAFWKAQYKQTNIRYGKACSIFEKKRTKGSKKPFLNLSFGRNRGKKKIAEQD